MSATEDWDKKEYIKFYYTDEKGNRYSKNRLNIRKGEYPYNYPLWPHQQQRIDTLPQPGNSYLYELPAGAGKTRMTAAIVGKICVANMQKGEHTACIVVAGSKSLAKSQMFEFGIVNNFIPLKYAERFKEVKPYTQSLQSDSKKNFAAFRLHNTVHPTVTMTTQMFSRIMNANPKKKRKTSHNGQEDSAEEEDKTFANQLRLISELGPDTRHVVIVIDEAHEMYRASLAKRKHQIKYSPDWHDVFLEHGISVTMIGTSATLCLDTEHARDNAARLFNVEVDCLDAMVHRTPDAYLEAHESKKKEQGVSKVKVVAPKCFQMIPAECTRNIANQVSQLAEIIVGSATMALTDSFVPHAEVPAPKRMNALVNCLTCVSMEMMLSEDYIETQIEKTLGGKPVNGSQYNEGEWESCKLYPNAVLFFQTDAMRAAYLAEMKESEKVHAIDMPADEDKAKDALDEFAQHRLVDEDTYDAEEETKIVTLCPSRVYRKGTNVLSRYTPSMLICVGNFSRDDLKQMHGRVGRFNATWKDGDCKPDDNIKVASVSLKWALSVHTMVQSLSETSRKTARNTRNIEEMQRLLAMVQTKDHEKVETYASILQKIAALDTPFTKRFLGCSLLEYLIDTADTNKNEANMEKFKSAVDAYSVATEMGVKGADEMQDSDSDLDDAIGHEIPAVDEDMLESLDPLVPQADGSSSSDIPLPLP
jgi:hypothetical protein